MYIFVYTCRCSYKYESVILPVPSPSKFPKCKHNRISAASMYSSSRLLEGHDRNTVFQTIGWFLALLSVRTLQTKSLWLCSHWHIKQEKDTVWSWTHYALSFLCFSKIKSFFGVIASFSFVFIFLIFKQLVIKKHSLLCNYINFNSVIAFW